ncbi:S-protein homolog 5-like [Cornus florida]|uniref:S-protein homolog 5-like n=1 Tax=Cornus florida TaxID=4283 RepID=UPI0028A1966C|nr:S-protein homolog 5-like [Cornus florida]
MNFTSLCSFAILVLAFYSMVTTGSVSNEDNLGIDEPIDVHVIDRFDINTTPKLIIHCKSKDDDLGEHTLSSGDDFHWHFRVNFMRTTLFFCTMRWGQKVLSFDVFDAAHNRCKATLKCFWSIGEDGVYFGDGHSPNYLVYRWP